MLEEQEKADRVVIANVDENDKPNKRHGNDNFYANVPEDYIHKLIHFYLLNGLDRWICTSCRGEVSSLMVPCQICKSFIRFVPLDMDEFKKFAKSKGCIPCWEKESTGRVVGDLQLQSLSDQGLHDETGRKCALCASNLKQKYDEIIWIQVGKTDHPLYEMIQCRDNTCTIHQSDPGVMMWVKCANRGGLKAFPDAKS